MENWDVDHNALSEIYARLDVTDSILLVVDGGMLHDYVVDVIKNVLSRDLYGIYVSLNKPHTTVESMLLRAGIDTKRIYFIDCVTKLAHKTLTKWDEHVIYAQGPHDLKSDGTIPAAINKFVYSAPGEKFLIIDALRTLFIYNEPDVVSAFIHSTLALTAAHDVKMIVLTRKGDKEFIKLVSKAFDEILEI
jgi:hypothetical protein